MRFTIHQKCVHVNFVGVPTINTQIDWPPFHTNTVCAHGMDWILVIFVAIPIFWLWHFVDNFSLALSLSLSLSSSVGSNFLATRLVYKVSYHKESQSIFWYGLQTIPLKCEMLHGCCYRKLSTTRSNAMWHVVCKFKIVTVENLNDFYLVLFRHLFVFVARVKSETSSTFHHFLTLIAPSWSTFKAWIQCNTPSSNLLNEIEAHVHITLTLYRDHFYTEMMWTIK